MSDYVTDEMVETAARAYHEAAPEAVAGSWVVSTPLIHERGNLADDPDDAVHGALAVLALAAELPADNAGRHAGLGVGPTPSAARLSGVDRLAYFQVADAGGKGGLVHLVLARRQCRCAATVP